MKDTTTTWFDLESMITRFGCISRLQAIIYLDIECFHKMGSSMTSYEQYIANIIFLVRLFIVLP
jgi:hypothetical protein